MVCKLVVLLDLMDTVFKKFDTVMEYSMNNLNRAIVGISIFISGYAYSDGDANYRHSRYCEVIVGKGLQASVYSSFRLNNCQNTLWDNLDVKSIKSQNKATFVYLNGPRHVLFDDYIYNKKVTNGEVKDFCGIKMHKSGALRITFSDILKGFRPYIEHKVYRDTTAVFKAGKPVYELISPNNKVYVMQSYSDEIVKQNDASLSKLGSVLHLPKGWRFKTVTLKDDKRLSTQNNIAIVTQDNLKNTYQLSSHGDLE